MLRGLLLAGSLLAALPAPAQIEAPELSYKLTRLEEPRPAPQFTLQDMDGNEHALADYRGQVVLLNFWATWCPPCRREMPSMERVYQELGDEGFQILAVNQFESPDLVFPYLGQLDVFPSFPILFDRSSAVADAFGVRGLPSSYVLDPQGRIVYKAIGGREFDHPQILEALRGLMR